MQHNTPHSTTPRPRAGARRRGAAAVLAMMFMVIFGSLAAAMAIVSQGNLRTADSQLKINRSMAAAETGMNFLVGRIANVAQTVQRTEGLITDSVADEIWYDGSDPANSFSTRLVTALSSELHNTAEPYFTGGSVYIGPINISPGSPTFSAVITPHPLVGEDYNSARYDAEPYATMGISATNKLDASWLRVAVTATDGPAGDSVSRTISIDFQIAKRIRYAMLSRSRIMLGRNVLIEGPIGSSFNEVNLANGHPIQVESDFRGLLDDLDDDLDLLVATLITNDTDGDNRLNTGVAAEVAGLADPAAYDISGDGYIDDFDFFLDRFDSNNNGEVTRGEMLANVKSGAETTAEQLLDLIDGAGSDSRAGFGDDALSADDRYAKINGSVYVSANMTDWENGAAGGEYEDFFSGPIVPDYGDDPLEFDSTENDAHSFDADDFSVSYYRSLATNSFAAVAGTFDDEVREAVPYAASYPYDYYDRRVYRNRTFENVLIEAGTNALFENCQFRGVVFIETERENEDPNFNYAGMESSDGTPKHPDRFVTINGTDEYDTKPFSNNIRFHDCEFHGSVVTSAPKEFTHVRNKLTFTGNTEWFCDTSPYLSDAQKTIYRSSSILAPHYSIELGPFVSTVTDTIELTGTIVSGLIDVRGQVEVRGTILTTFTPISNTGPVLGNTSPQFNTTLGYFGSASGDLESELPTGGLGRIKVTYDPALPLPEGILGPIECQPVWSTYYEGN